MEASRCSPRTLPLLTFKYGVLLLLRSSGVGGGGGWGDTITASEIIPRVGQYPIERLWRFARFFAFSVAREPLPLVVIPMGEDGKDWI